MSLLSRHFPPMSEIENDYQRVSACPRCEAHYPWRPYKKQSGDVCPRCGYDGVWLSFIARWVRRNPRWQFWKNVGYWQPRGKGQDD